MLPLIAIFKILYKKIRNTICRLRGILKMFFLKHCSRLTEIHDHVWGKNMSHETQDWEDIPHVLCILEWCIQLKSWVPIYSPPLKLKLISLMIGAWLNQIQRILERLYILHGSTKIPFSDAEWAWTFRIRIQTKASANYWGYLLDPGHFQFGVTEVLSIN